MYLHTIRFVLLSCPSSASGNSYSSEHLHGNLVPVTVGVVTQNEGHTGARQTHQGQECHDGPCGGRHGGVSYHPAPKQP